MIVLLVRAFVLAALVVGVCAPAAAAADRAQLPVMLEVAEAGFGQNPCGDRLHVEWVEAQNLGTTVDGMEIVGQGGGCMIRLAGLYFDGAGWVWACHLVAHEYGHAALGLKHVDDPTALMYGGRPTVQWPPCLSFPDILARKAEADHYDDLAARYDLRSERLNAAWFWAMEVGHDRHARSLSHRAAACVRAARRLRDRAIAIRRAV